MSVLGRLFHAKSQHVDAERLMRRAPAIDEQSYGAEHPNVAIRLSNLAALLQATNRLAEAEPLMRWVMEIFLRFTQRAGHQHPHLDAAFGNYASVLKATGLNGAEISRRLTALLAEYGMSLG